MLSPPAAMRHNINSKMSSPSAILSKTIALARMATSVFFILFGHYKLFVDVVKGAGL
jgi:hypothetical protein